jgi:hypothetical protein
MAVAVVVVVVVVVAAAVVRAPAEERIVAAKVIDEAYADSVQTESAFAWPSLVIAFGTASRWGSVLIACLIELQVWLRADHQRECALGPSRSCGPSSLHDGILRSVEWCSEGL